AEVLARWPATAVPGLPPFQGGAAGLFGYGLARVLERLPKPKSEDFWLHDLVVGFYDWVVAFDNYQGRAWLVSTGWPETDAARRRDRADRRRATVHRRLCAEPSWPRTRRPRTPAERLVPQFPLPGWPGVTSNFDRAGYLAAVRRAVEYIHAGD